MFANKKLKLVIGLNCTVFGESWAYESYKLKVTRNEQNPIKEA